MSVSLLGGLCCELGNAALDACRCNRGLTRHGVLRGVYSDCPGWLRDPGFLSSAGEGDTDLAQPGVVLSRAQRNGMAVCVRSVCGQCPRCAATAACCSVPCCGRAAFVGICGRMQCCCRVFRASLMAILGLLSCVRLLRLCKSHALQYRAVQSWLGAC